MKNTYSIEIAVAPERVFHWLDSSERAMRWLPNLVESEDLTQTPSKVGSTFRHVYLERGRRMELRGEVTGYEPNRRLASTLRGELFDLIVDYRLEDLGGRTRLTQEYETQFNSLPMRIMGALMSPLLKKASLKAQHDSFEKLKQLAESGA